MHREGWIILDIDRNWEVWARNVREQRDRLYGNVFPVQETDERWVGELAEKVFDSWMKHNKIENYHWITADPAGKPDFELNNGIRIGVKSVKRAVQMKTNYSAQISAEHRDEPVDYFFFMSYQITMQRMWLLGGIDRESFLAQAQFYKAGEMVHDNYAPLDHDIYNIGVTKLTAPIKWLREITTIPSKSP
jgi:hypothetical protein